METELCCIYITVLSILRHFQNKHQFNLKFNCQCQKDSKNVVISNCTLLILVVNKDMDSDKKVDYTDETVICTPLPRASSTTDRKNAGKQKRDIKKIPLTYSPDLSRTSLKNDRTSIDQSFLLDMSAKLQEQRKLTENVLKKRSVGLPSPYLKKVVHHEDTSIFSQAIASESTVNESDLLNSKTHDSKFHPNSISTPRASNVSDELLNNQSPTASIISDAGLMCDSLAEIYQKMKYSDHSIKELCEKFQQFHTSNSFYTKDDSESFVPLELANEQLLADELLWKKEHAALGTKQATNESAFATVNSFMNQKMSISECFHGKSEDLSKLFENISPEKYHEPVALIDESLQNLSDVNYSERDSVAFFSDPNDSLSISQIAKALQTDDTPTKIVENLLYKKKTEPLTAYAKSQCSQDQSFKSPTLTKFESNSKENEGVNKNILIPKSKDNVLKHSNYNEESLNMTKQRENMHLSDNKTTFSSRSSSSLSNLPNGKLPIETNNLEMVWGCLKVGKKSIKEFVLRNKSQSKLRIQASVTGFSFKIMKDRSESEMLNTLTILLHPMESRSIAVVFLPTKVGASVEKLGFSPIDDTLQRQQSQPQYIKLFGYGGHISLEMNNVAKDTSGKVWFSLGLLNHNAFFKRDFAIRNNGTLAMFVCLNIESRELFRFSNVVVNVNNFVLKPNDQTRVTITFTPTKDDIRLFMECGMKTEVLDIGFIKVTFGPEPLRGRIRKLYTNVKNKSTFVKDTLIENLSAPFIDEHMPQDLKYFKETVGSMKMLLQELTSKEVTLTLEHDPEKTLGGHIAGVDETSMYHSLYQEVTVLEKTLQNTSITTKCRVEPNCLVLLPPNKIEDSILLISENSIYLPFEVKTIPANILDVHPSDGILTPRDTIVIKVACANVISEESVKLMIYIENDVFVVNVKVVLIRNRK